MRPRVRSRRDAARRDGVTRGRGNPMADDVQGLTEGTTATYTTTVTQDAINTFANVTGDTNPLHSNAEYAARTR
ncbi:MAG: hypothetical protein KC458_09120, partial [Dehalococcoidia bacterium]|nr:hypothetical protein [Dehalococcoidia bacterium]